MKPLKILMTSACYDPDNSVAAETHIKRLSQELIARGHEVHIIYSWDANRYKGYAIENDSKISRKDDNGIYLHPIHLSIGAFNLKLVYFYGSTISIENKFKKVVDDIKPDVVHHHNIFFLGHKILRKYGDYLNLYTAHDYWLICTRNDLLKNGNITCQSKACLSCGLSSINAKRPPQLWRLSKSYRNSLKDIALILAPSCFMKEKLGLELSNSIVHLPVFALPPQNIDNSGFSDYFLYAGVLGRHKGIMNLLEVFRFYGDKIKPKLIIVGRGVLEAEIKSFIEKYNLQNKVILIGWVSNEKLWSLYKDAVALVIPSVWAENCPVVVLEAMATGTPTIGSDQGGLPELITKIDDNLIFKSDDIEELAGKLINFDTRRYSAKKLQDIYKKYYSIEAYLQEYEKLLKTFH